MVPLISFISLGQSKMRAGRPEVSFSLSKVDVALASTYCPHQPIEWLLCLVKIPRPGGGNASDTLLVNLLFRLAFLFATRVLRRKSGLLQRDAGVRNVVLP